LIRGERKFDEHQKTAVLRGVLAVCEQIANVPFNIVTAMSDYEVAPDCLCGFCKIDVMSAAHSIHESSCVAIKGDAIDMTLG
jgi:hypothetical protein